MIMMVMMMMVIMMINCWIKVSASQSVT